MTARGGQPAYSPRPGLSRSPRFACAVRPGAWSLGGPVVLTHTQCGSLAPGLYSFLGTPTQSLLTPPLGTEERASYQQELLSRGKAAGRPPGFPRPPSAALLLQPPPREGGARPPLPGLPVSSTGVLPSRVFILGSEALRCGCASEAVVTREAPGQSIAAGGPAPRQAPSSSLSSKGGGWVSLPTLPEQPLSPGRGTFQRGGGVPTSLLPPRGRTVLSFPPPRGRVPVDRCPWVSPARRSSSAPQIPAQLQRWEPLPPFCPHPGPL